jgi:hypothetical protein
MKSWRRSICYLRPLSLLLCQTIFSTIFIFYSKVGGLLKVRFDEKDGGA